MIDGTGGRRAATYLLLQPGESFEANGGRILVGATAAQS